MKERLSASEIISQYKGGRRDFSEIECTSADFTNVDLKCIIFRKANLQFCTFNGCELQGSDFSEADLDWAGFKRANLTEAKLVKAKCRYALFDDSIFDRADVRDADFSWSRMLNVNFSSADRRGASFVMAAFTLADMSQAALSHVSLELSRHKGNVPFDVLLQIKFIASGTMDKLAAISAASQAESSPTSYRGSAGIGNYRVGTEGRREVTYAGGITPYQMSVRYRSAKPYER